MTHIRKRDLYREQREKVGPVCLRTLHQWGDKGAEQIFRGNIHAVVIALMALIGRNETDKFLKELIGDLPPPRTKPSLIWSRSA